VQYSHYGRCTEPSLATTKSKEEERLSHSSSLCL